MSKPLLRVVCSATVAVDVMTDLMDENVVEVEVPDGIEVVAAKVEGMGAQKDAVPPIAAIAAERALPRPFLFAGAGKKEDGAEPDKVLGRHPANTTLDLVELAGVDEIRRQR